MKRFFTLDYWKDDGWFVGRIREVPGVFSQGETLDGLQENIADAYSMMIETFPTLSAKERFCETLRLQFSASSAPLREQ
jgi:predicted RNase H-like HicB family nuclease